jgi:GNAT superfamily N-acetyltransferase
MWLQKLQRWWLFTADPATDDHPKLQDTAPTPAPSYAHTDDLCQQSRINATTVKKRKRSDALSPPTGGVETILALQPVKRLKKSDCTSSSLTDSYDHPPSYPDRKHIDHRTHPHVVSGAANKPFTNSHSSTISTNTTTLQYEVRRYRDEPNEQTWTQLKQELFWDSSVLCGKAVREVFRKECIDEADTFLVAFYTKPSRPTRGHSAGVLRQYMGIVVLKEYPAEGRLYIELICSSSSCPGLGRQLMKRTEQYAKRFRNPRYTHLQLSSLAYVINFYRKLGFRHSLRADAAEDPKITTIIDDGSRRKRRNNTHCQQGSVKPSEINSAASNNSSSTNNFNLTSLKFRTDDEAKDHPQFAQLLKLLVKFKLTKDKTVHTVADANVEGYIMTKSLL